MNVPSIGRTQWFSLSGRELITLVIGVGLVLLAIGIARTVEAVWGRPELTITEAGDVLPPSERLNVNTATDYELAMLPGIGPKTAAAITGYRDRYGPFATLDDVTKVSGVGPATVERIRPHAMCAPVPDTPGGGPN